VQCLEPLGLGQIGSEHCGYDNDRQGGRNPDAIAERHKDAQLKNRDADEK
jgi:hypothetical protein